jgi:glyoxylase-like metal-dependent hydrolase (beta-lactamase superfamily II)
VNIGLVRDGKRAIVIDSGIDKDSGRRIVKAIEALGWHIDILINTHSHADHCGGNKYIQEKTNAQTYAPAIEAGIIQVPYLEPLFLSGGASPIRELQNGFLMACPSRVDVVIEGQRELQFGSVNIKIIPLPGHSLNQIGLDIEDTLFCADSIFSEEILQKHKIPFFIDIEREKQTLDFLQNTTNKFYVPSHAKPCTHIGNLVMANSKVIQEVQKCIAEKAENSNKDQILRGVCDWFGVELREFPQYYLTSTAVMAYLSYLEKQGLLEPTLVKNELFWRRK